MADGSVTTAQFIDSLEFIEYWNSTDSGRKEFIEEWLKDYIVEVFLEESKFAKRISKGKSVNTLAPTWQTQRGFPRSVTAQVADAGGGNYQVTFSGKFNGNAMTANYLKQVVKKGTILQKVVDGVVCQVKVTSIPGDDLTLTCEAYGGTTLAVDSAARTYALGSPAWSDKRDFEQPTSLDRKLDHTFTEIFMREVQITDTDEELKERLISDPLSRQLDLNMRDMSLEKAWKMINGRPVWDVATSTWLTGYDTDAPAMAGLLWWALKAQTDEANPGICVDMGGAPPTDVALRNIGHQLYVSEHAKIKAGNYYVLGHPTTLRHFENLESQYIRTTKDDDTIGFEKKRILIEHEEIEFMADLAVDQDMLFLVGCDDLSYGPFGKGVKRKKFETKGFYTQWGIKEHIWGLMPENPRWIGLLYNVRPFGE